MTKKIVLGSFAFVLIYAGFVNFQVFWMRRDLQNRGPENISSENPVHHKVYSFSFAKYASDGEKEIEIEGDSANILTQTVFLSNVVAKAYAEETPVTITADQGDYNKATGKVHLQKNVVATTEDGTRLLTEALDIHPTNRVMETEVQAEVKKENINVEGVGARGDSNLKKVEFKKEVTVVIQDPENQTGGQTVITCDGPLTIDYEKNIAHFKDHVIAKDARGKLTGDTMDVYYNRVTHRVSKIVALGNVVIENPDGNKTYSDNVIYLAEEGRVILGGDAEAIYFEGGGLDEEVWI